MKNLITVLATLLLTTPAWAEPTEEQPDRNVEAYRLDDGIGLKGYDPVSYFEEGGGQPLQGSEEIAGTYGGVIYHFASEENKDLFFENPTKYEPTYGGWCAWAMANDSYANINPLIYTIHGNRSHFFIGQGPKARFDLNIETHEPNADDFWKSESGEAPRL